MGRKVIVGQSAIEYLMTYGWMLLVVAVVGGAVFSIVQGESIESTSGFTGEDVVVENFGLSQGGSLDFVLRNGGAEEVEINSVEVLDEEGDEAYVYPAKSLDVGDSSSVSVPNVVESSGSNSLDLRVSYDMGGLSDLSVEGSVSGGIGVEPEVWESDVDGDGGVESAEFYGSGSSVSPYRVGSVEGLQMISQESGSSFELGSDIDASGTSSWNGGSGFDPIDSFSGALNGQNHVVEDLFIDRNNDQIGLAASNSGTIKNINMVGADIDGANKVGSIAGQNNGNIKNIYQVGELNGSDRVGGLVGQNGGNLTQSYSNANVTGNGNDISGIAGINIGGNIRNVYSSNQIINGGYEGAITGYNTGIVEYSYWDQQTTESSGGIGLNAGTSTSVTGLDTSEMTGDSAADNMDGFDFQDVWRTVDGDYPELR